MSDKNLEAELLAAKKRIAELEAKVKPEPDEVSIRKARVASVKAAAMKSADGKMATYVVGKPGHYREGRLYHEGEHITLPVSEDPSTTWAPFKGEASVAAPPAPAQGPQKRASDRDVA